MEFLKIKFSQYLLLSLFILAYQSINAQTISLTTTNTATVCFNDGTLTVNASGGVAPYSYSITSGPINPNISYPINIPLGQNVFFNMTHGTFTILVTDATGNSRSFTASVAGTYQFPTMTFDTTSIPGVICQVSDGRPPYQYAVSSTGSNTGFGPYQSSDTFATICPGKYWLRVRDSCGNIFTNVLTFSYLLGGKINCTNYSNGILNTSASGGHAPYTFSFSDFNNVTTTNNTGAFSGLGSYFQGNLAITDSCGIQLNIYITPPNINPSIHSCPYDSNLYCKIPWGDTLTFICTNCNPVQSVTINGPSNTLNPDTIFHHLSTSTPRLVILTHQDSCGIDTIPYYIGVVAPIYIVHIEYKSCNSVLATVIGSTSTFTIDSFVLSASVGGPTIESNTSGFFYHIPDGGYIVTAYLSGACDTLPSVVVNIPAMNYGCFQLMKDSTCQNTWWLNVIPLGHELYSLISPQGDTTIETRIPIYTGGYFYNVTPSNIYTLISDSGCSVPLVTPSVPPYRSTITSYLPCVGPPIIAYSDNAYDYCLLELRFKFFTNSALVKDTIIHYTNTHPTFVFQDSGWYHYEVYLPLFLDYPSVMRFDTICPLDSGSIYVSNIHIPYPYPNFAYVCDTNSTDSIVYHIYGGAIPYTVQIPGYDTTTMLTNAGVFPTHHPGAYTMIVYDDCGVSRSITFSVIDTCTGCPYTAIALADTFFCEGDTVHLRSATFGAVSFQWLVNNQLFSTARDTFFISTATGYDIQLRATGRAGCIDSALAHITAVFPYSIHLGSDTSYCDTFSRVLSTGISSTLWSTGQIGSQIMIDSPGRYWATAFNKCGVFSDTVNIISNQIKGFSLSASQNNICNDQRDSVVLYAFIDSVSQPRVTFMWSNGLTDSLVYSSMQTGHTAGTYQVTVKDGLCQTTKEQIISAVECDSNCAHKIAIPDIFTPNGDNKNDTFMIIHSCKVNSFSMHIYNRWGQLVFESTDIDKGWDGNYRGKQEPEEVYLWFICVQETAGSPNTCKSGTLTLVR